MGRVEGGKRRKGGKSEGEGLTNILEIEEQEEKGGMSEESPEKGGGAVAYDGIKGSAALTTLQSHERPRCTTRVPCVFAE
ncbi:unnamed protein product [Pleuronectes platessa]|uniref:Uncharacterized protein n=1 Tax=Pleuronectes platessa TaxID=8262 RepID=A0A9N7Z585_PLEPL|nr:unnamed protein product [Pleuronectes platessa]